MRLRRGFVFWGLFLIPLGAIPLIARANVVPTDRFADAWRLWPLALIGVGLLLVAGRTRASIAATAVVALLVGSLAGAAFAAGPPWIGTIADCGLQPGGPAGQVSRSGAWSGSPSVRLDLRCGTLDVHPAGAGTWQVDATYRGSPPIITASDTRLALTAPDGTHRQDWAVALPLGAVDRIELVSNAATSRVRLDGVALGTLAATVNAGDLLVDVGTGRIDQVETTINAGQLRVIGGAADLRGTVSVNAGGVDLCLAPTAALRLTVTDQLTFSHNLASRGLTRIGQGAWTRDGSGPTMILRIDGNAAALTLDPEGGCR